MIQIRDKFSYLLFGFTILFRTFCILYSRQKKHKIPSNKIIIKLIFNAFWKEHFTTFAQEIFTSAARSSKRYKKISCNKGMWSNMTEIDTLIESGAVFKVAQNTLNIMWRRFSDSLRLVIYWSTSQPKLRHLGDLGPLKDCAPFCFATLKNAFC